MSTTTLHTSLLKGLTYSGRTDGTVYTVKNSTGSTVAEICVGKKISRLNFKQPLPEGTDTSILSGRSKSWAGGGVRLTPDNLAAATELLAAATA